MTEQTDDVKTGPAELGEKLSVIMYALNNTYNGIDRLERGNKTLDADTIEYGLLLLRRQLDVLHQIEDDLRRLARLDDALEVLSANGKPRGGY